MAPGQKKKKKSRGPPRLPAHHPSASAAAAAAAASEDAFQGARSPAAGRVSLSLRLEAASAFTVRPVCISRFLVVGIAVHHCGNQT